MLQLASSSSVAIRRCHSFRHLLQSHRAAATYLSCTPRAIPVSSSQAATFSRVSPRNELSNQYCGHGGEALAEALTEDDVRRGRRERTALGQTFVPLDYPLVDRGLVDPLTCDHVDKLGYGGAS